MATQNRVHTIAYNSETNEKVGETISATMVDFHCDSSRNEDFLMDIYSWDFGVRFKHQIFELEVPELPEDISHFATWNITWEL